MSGFSYSHGRPVPGNRGFSTDGKSDQRRRQEMADDDAYEKATQGGTPEDIRGVYASEVKARAAGSSIVGPDVEHTRDLQSFEKCVKQFGWVATIRALLTVSKCAQEQNAAYWKRRREGRR